MIYLRETSLNGLVLYSTSESHTIGTITHVLKQNIAHHKKNLLHPGDTLFPSAVDMEFQTEEEAICWACLHEL